MDFIDNLMYATVRRPQARAAIARSYFFGLWPGIPFPTLVNNFPFNFINEDKMRYVSFPDTDIIHEALRQHWRDVSARISYNWPGANNPISNFGVVRPYHLIHSYCIDSTRVAQIMERVIEKYVGDEELGIANNGEAFRWIQNTVSLFYKSDNFRELKTKIKSNSEAARRNSYFRLLGLEVPFGDPTMNQPFAYEKAKVSNQQFVPLFEQYLSEIWQGYINARNLVGPNTTDTNNLVALARRLQELLTARRGQNAVYFNQNLSYEEFYSAFTLTWYSFVLSYNSPIVQFLQCDSNTFGERLQKLSVKVGIPSHKKSQALFELAGPISIILRSIEAGGILNNQLFVTNMLQSLNPPAGIVSTPAQRFFMQNLLETINNWERATSHKIKNREANIAGTVRVAQMARGTLVAN